LRHPAQGFRTLGERKLNQGSTLQGLRHLTPLEIVPLDRCHNPCRVEYKGRAMPLTQGSETLGYNPQSRWD
jgi:hypothetical protein